MKDDAPQIRSFVRQEGTNNWFVVITSERDSSSPVAEGHRYRECLVFAYDPKMGNYGDLLGNYECRGGLRMHFELCDSLWRTGKPE